MSRKSVGTSCTVKTKNTSTNTAAVVGRAVGVVHVGGSACVTDRECAPDNIACDDGVRQSCSREQHNKTVSCARHT